MHHTQVGLKGQQTLGGGFAHFHTAKMNSHTIICVFTYKDTSVTQQVPGGTQMDTVTEPPRSHRALALSRYPSGYSFLRYPNGYRERRP